MTTEWPAWATLRSIEVREQLPNNERGPWRERADCSVTDPEHDQIIHKAEPPYFYYCPEHIEVARGTHPQETPSPLRDQGLCKWCGEPAELRPEKKQDRVAAALAERTNSTIARIRTKEYCINCNPRHQPICQGETCRKADQQLKVLPTRCCPSTRKIADRHCELCCAENRKALQKQKRSAQGRKAGLGLGRSAQAKKGGHIRRLGRKG